MHRIAFIFILFAAATLSSGIGAAFVHVTDQMAQAIQQ